MSRTNRFTTTRSQRCGAALFGLLLVAASACSGSESAADQASSTEPTSESTVDTNETPEEGIPAEDSSGESSEDQEDSSSSGETALPIACDLITETQVYHLVGFEVIAENIDLRPQLNATNCNFDGADGRVRISASLAINNAADEFRQAYTYSEEAGFEVSEVEGYGDQAHMIDGTLQVLVGEVTLQAFTERGPDPALAFDVMDIMLSNL